MTRRLMGFLLVTDVVFLLYWLASLLDLLNILTLPASMMYAGHDQPRVFAWSWSFFPLDMLFSISGLWAIRLGKAGDPRWLPVATISLCLTFVAGLMAISYWSIMGEFDPSWFLSNLALALWPLFFLPSILRKATNTARTEL